MSAIRQRRGASGASEPTKTEGLSEAGLKGLDKLKQHLMNADEKPKPSMSNVAKKAKDALEEDPFNLELMYKLGKAHADDNHWTQCGNVLLRGWKRMSEVSDEELVFDFLVQLCEASMKLDKWKQASAVLSDIVPLKDPDDLRHYSLLACKVYAENGVPHESLAAFRVAVDGIDFAAALNVWVECAASLRHAGLYASARATMQSLATVEEDGRKLEVLETLIELKEHGNKTQKQPASTTQRNTVIALVVLLLTALLYGTYLLERQTFDAFKGGK